MIFLKKLFLNKYTKYVITIFILFIWITFFYGNSWLIIPKLNEEIKTYNEQIEFYQNEFEKNKLIYKQITKNKQAREKFARENYFMKKDNEEIFILVVDSTATSKK